ncbi:unnamed protein product [Boreogadus saida]
MCVLSLLQKLMSDSAVLTLAGSSFHTTAVPKQKSCAFDDRLFLALSDGASFAVIVSKLQASGKNISLRKIPENRKSQLCRVNCLILTVVACE